MGIINSHFSLLPEWRGADPISFAILSGQNITGVSLMMLVEKMDEGPLIAQGSYEISKYDTGPSLTAGLIELSTAMLKATMQDYLDGKIVPYEQTETLVKGAKIATSYSRKLTKSDGELDFNLSAPVLERQVRAFLEWPKSHTMINGQDVIITQAGSRTHNKLGPGAIAVVNNELLIGCHDSALEILKLKPAGRKEMSAPEFIRGYRLT